MDNLSQRPIEVLCGVTSIRPAKSGNGFWVTLGPPSFPRFCIKCENTPKITTEVWIPCEPTSTDAVFSRWRLKDGTWKYSFKYFYHD